MSELQTDQTMARMTATSSGKENNKGLKGIGIGKGWKGKGFTEKCKYPKL